MLVDTEFNFLGEIFKSILNDVKFVCTNLQLCTSKTNVLFLPKCSHSFPIQSKEYLGNTATYCLKVIVTKIWSSVLSLIIARFGYHAFIISNNWVRLSCSFIKQIISICLQYYDYNLSGINENLKIYNISKIMFQKNTKK